ncbi:MAG TPA: 50S ribosomal protein L19 [Phycisphaerales bacterium]|nr:50S ribosomal protein L19 [Phycisphaerales bacterium]
MQQILESINAESLKTNLPIMDIGDTINVHVRIVEGDKERIQVFQGVLISRKGRGITEMITVRRVVDNEGIERTWPINSPMISKFEVVRRADARRAKLYFLRDRVGKSRRLRDRRRGLKHVEGQKTVG